MYLLRLATFFYLLINYERARHLHSSLFFIRNQTMNHSTSAGHWPKHSEPLSETKPFLASKSVVLYFFYLFRLSWEMATTAPASEVLQSTTGKANFQREARLLISGGTTLLKETFDQLCPPSNLPPQYCKIQPQRRNSKQQGSPSHSGAVCTAPQGCTASQLIWY